MKVMAYSKLICADDIVRTAVRMIEADDADGLSLRAIAGALGVKAPSLYRYFPDKGALELAVAEESLRVLQTEMKEATSGGNPDARFRAVVEAYLRFARERFRLYSFIMDRVPQTYGSAVAKEVWNLLLRAASDISGRPDDTAAAVAVWSFLHGYSTLQHSGAFGASGPKGGLELGLEAFLHDFRHRAVPDGTGKAVGAKGARRRQGQGRAWIAG